MTLDRSVGQPEPHLCQFLSLSLSLSLSSLLPPHPPASPGQSAPFICSCLGSEVRGSGEHLRRKLHIPLFYLKGVKRKAAISCLARQTYIWYFTMRCFSCNLLSSVGYYLENVIFSELKKGLKFPDFSHPYKW